MSGMGRLGYWAAVAACALLMVGIARYHGLTDLFKEYRYSENEVRVLESRLESLQDDAAHLERNVEGLHDDPLAMEAEIRRSKGFVRDGERIYRIQRPADSAPEQD